MLWLFYSRGFYGLGPRSLHMPLRHHRRKRRTAIFSTNGTRRLHVSSVTTSKARYWLAVVPDFAPETSNYHKSWNGHFQTHGNHACPRLNMGETLYWQVFYLGYPPVRCQWIPEELIGKLQGCSLHENLRYRFVCSLQDKMYTTEINASDVKTTAELSTVALSLPTILAGRETTAVVIFHTPKSSSANRTEDMVTIRNLNLKSY